MPRHQFWPRKSARNTLMSGAVLRQTATLAVYALADGREAPGFNNGHSSFHFALKTLYSQTNSLFTNEKKRSWQTSLFQSCLSLQQNSFSLTPNFHSPRLATATNRGQIRECSYSQRRLARRRNGSSRSADTVDSCSQKPGHSTNTALPVVPASPIRGGDGSCLGGRGSGTVFQGLWRPRRAPRPDMPCPVTGKLGGGSWLEEGTA